MTNYLKVFKKIEAQLSFFGLAQVFWIPAQLSYDNDLVRNLPLRCSNRMSAKVTENGSRTFPASTKYVASVSQPCHFGWEIAPRAFTVAPKSPRFFKLDDFIALSLLRIFRSRCFWELECSTPKPKTNCNFGTLPTGSSGNRTL